MEECRVRSRVYVQNDNVTTKQEEMTNGEVSHFEKRKDTEFALRESPLTELMESSLHIRAIYHIFVVILLVLLCDTVIFDLVERGKINVGLSVIANGFGDILRGVKLWLFDLTVALAFYPALRIYALAGKISKQYPGIRDVLPILGAFGLVGTQLALISVSWHLGKKQLALASSVAVTCEMFRYMMKVHAVAMACGSRCLDGSAPLPPFTHYLYFLFAPTLIYRDQYPRTKTIRWGVVVFYFLEVSAIIFYHGFLWERFILPYWSDYGKQSKVEAGIVVRGMFACVLPGMICFLCSFYCVLHVWQNAFAEMLRFGDRLFYEISSVAHEVILALSFGFFYPVLLLQFGVFGLLLVPLTATSGRRFPNVFNLLMWLSFFIGNGLLWSLYPMEYFARKNCPPSENDTFFVPKSWTCPEITLKANWTFENPLY